MSCVSCVSCVSPHAALLIILSLYHLSKTLVNSVEKKIRTRLDLFEHPPVRGKNVKTFRWDHRLQIQECSSVPRLALTCHGTGARLCPEGNGPIPQQEEFGSDQLTLADVYRFSEESFDRQLKIMKSRYGQQDKKLSEFMKEMRATEQHSASLEQDAR